MGTLINPFGSQIYINKMIDKIDLRKSTIGENELKEMIKKANLKHHTKNGLEYWDNKDTKRFNGGFFIQVDTNRKFKIVGSVHKFKSFLTIGILDNSENITMGNAKETIIEIIKYYGIPNNDLKIYSYEIGLNITTPNEAKEYLTDMIRIKDKILFINPKYKNETLKTTYIHRDFRHVFYMYDKNHEIKEKQKRTKDFNILRFEYKHQRIYKLDFKTFIQDSFLKQVRNFFNDWFSCVQFIPVIKYIGSGQSSAIELELAKRITLNGTEHTLNECKEHYKEGGTTPKQYRKQREFIRDWFIKELYKNFEITLTTKSTLLKELYQSGFNELIKKDSIK